MPRLKDQEVGKNCETKTDETPKQPADGGFIEDIDTRWNKLKHAAILIGEMTVGLKQNDVKNELFDAQCEELTRQKNGKYQLILQKGLGQPQKNIEKQGEIRKKYIGSKRVKIWQSK